MKKSIIENRDILTLQDGIHDTFLPNVKIFKTKTYEKSPLIYDVCLILVLQGKKIANLASNRFAFDCDNYLVVPTTLPLECETYATEEEPFICLIISLERTMMVTIIEALAQREFRPSTHHSMGIFSDHVTNAIEETTSKLLDILESKEEALILGDGVLKELFTALRSDKMPECCTKCSWKRTKSQRSRKRSNTSTTTTIRPSIWIRSPECAV